MTYNFGSSASPNQINNIDWGVVDCKALTYLYGYSKLSTSSKVYHGVDMFNQNSLIDITTAFVNDQIIQSAELDLDGLIHFRLNLDNEWLVFGPTVPIDNGVDDDGIIVENLMEQMSYGYKYNWFGRGVKQMHVFRFPEDAADSGNNLLYHNEVWNSTWPSNFSADIEVNLLNNTPNFSLASNTNYVINDDLLHEIIGDDHEFTVTYYVKVRKKVSNKFVIYKDSATEEYLDLGSHIKQKIILNIFLINQILQMRGIVY